MVEISLDDHKNSKSSAPLLVVYSIVTCLLVGVHLLALMISTCILPQLEADSLVGYDEYSSHTTMHVYIELAWILSTGFGKIYWFFVIYQQYNSNLYSNKFKWLFLIISKLLCLNYIFY